MSEASPYILVVEDELPILEMLREVLTLEGYSSVGAASPAAACHMTEQQPPDLFLIDLMLPGRDGVALAQDLYALGCDQTPMIGMSASPTMLQAAVNSGLFGTCIAKPFDLATLLDDIERLLSEKQSKAG